MTTQLPTLETSFPIVSADTFRERFDWKQGEHVTVIGPTGWGKSTAIKELVLPRRDYVVAFATKRKDSTMDELQAQGYKVQSKFQPDVADHIILKPKMTLSNDAEIRNTFKNAIDTIWWSGGWCMDWDEAVYMAEELKLKSLMSKMWMQGRSLGVSIVAATQRPAFLPLYAYDQATHFFFWKMKLQDDAMRVARLGGLDIREMLSTIRQLPKYWFLYHNKETEETLISNPRYNV